MMVYGITNIRWPGGFIQISTGGKFSKDLNNGLSINNKWFSNSCYSAIVRRRL